MAVSHITEGPEVSEGSLEESAVNRGWEEIIFVFFFTITESGKRVRADADGQIKEVKERRTIWKQQKAS